MGLHRTDIALSVYWVFYGADQGLDAPNLRGYTEASGHDTNNIMQVLNAMYICMTERNGQNPMPEEVFKERKNAINEKRNAKINNPNYKGSQTALNNSEILLINSIL